MKKVLLPVSFLLFVMGCATTVPHPITGTPVRLPNAFVGKVSFELSLKYTYKGNDMDFSALLVETLQSSGLPLEITSITPLIGKTTNQLQLGDLQFTGVYPTFTDCNFYILRQNELNIGIKPTFGGYPTGVINEWIYNDHLDILKSRLDAILNPIGFER